MPEQDSWPRGTGEMAARVRSYDWAATALGALETWSPSLRTAASLVLAAPSPMLLLWGDELIQIYNDANREILGGKHPGGLGQRNQECWNEVWEFAHPYYQRVFQGESFTLEDQRLTLERHGFPEEAYFNISYSPVFTDEATVGGVLVAVSETTDKALRRQQERMSMLEEVFHTAPSFLHVLRGPQFVFEFANEAYYQLVGHRELIGRPAFEAMPEAAEGGYQERIAAVMATGNPFYGRELPVTLARTPGAPPEERIIDLVYLPLKDADGRCTRVLGHGTDVTDHVRARRQVEVALRESEVRRAESVLREHEARESEAALRASEERFRLMADAVPQIVWITNREGQTEFFNKQWAHFAGAPYEPSTAEEFTYEFAHPEDAERILTAFRAAQNTASTLEVEYRIRSASGEYRWFLVRAEPYCDPDTGEILRWFGAFVDIHDRKEAEAALLASQARQAFLLQLSDHLRPLADPLEVQYEAACTLGAYLGANRAGYAEDQGDGETVVVGRHYTHGVPGIEGRHRYDDYGPELLRAFHAGRTVVRPDTANDPSLTEAERKAHAALQLGSTVNVPLVKDGRLVAICFVHHQEAHPWTAEEVALVEDTAERTWSAVQRARAEAALRESEARYRRLFEAMDEGFCVIEVMFDAEDRPYDYRFLELNPAFEVHTGIKNGLGRTMREFAPEHETQWFETYGRVARTGEPLRFQQSAATLGRYYDLYAFRVGEPEQRRVAVLFSDVTERHRAAEALREADRRKDEFLATLAHELRNPLAPIVTATEVLRLRADDPARVERARETIRRQVEHMRRLVDDLLDVARITRGMVALQLETVELGAVLTGALQMARPLIEARDQELRVSVPLETVRLDGDPHRLIQVVTNLLTNAAKFTPPGGRITVTAERNGPEAVIRVADTGKGIPAEMLPHIWDLFTQANPSIDRAEGGLGLGLTLVRQLVEMHGGRVEARSAGMGRGSEFVVRLPVHPPVSVPLKPAFAPTEPAGESALRVLVVDDNVDAADSMAELLALWGHTARVAYSGHSALPLAEEFRPEVVLLDIGLPGMDGYEVAQRLRSAERADGMRLVAVTGFGQVEDRQSTREAGFDAHLTKPVDPESLRRVLEAWPSR